MTKSQPNTHTLREAWLVAASERLGAEFFTKNGYTIPDKVQCSCGWPRGGRNAIGQCWSPEISSNGTTHLFICPTQDEPIRVLDILLHELVHAAVGVQEGHRGAFKKVATEFGLAGKMTETYAAEGSELWLKLSHIAQELGPYPHAKVTKVARKSSSGGKWVRLQSPVEETFTVTISPKTLEAIGYPMDPWGNEMEEVVKE